MAPRLERLHKMLGAASPGISSRVGPKLASLDDLRSLWMVVSHCDLGPENLIVRIESSVSVVAIDWEFCAYVPEFHVAVPFESEFGRETWGEGFLCGYGPYPPEVI